MKVRCENWDKCETTDKCVMKHHLPHEHLGPICNTKCKGGKCIPVEEEELGGHEWCNEQPKEKEKEMALTEKGKLMRMTKVELVEMVKGLRSGFADLKTENTRLGEHAIKLEKERDELRLQREGLRKDLDKVETGHMKTIDDLKESLEEAREEIQSLESFIAKLAVERGIR